MKKILLATTMIVAGAGIAAADVTVSGSGRFGLVYYSKPGAGMSKTIIDHRLQFDITGTKETDAGVTFGGKFRLRNNDGENITAGNQALLFAEYMGLRLEVGNANTAIDSAGLIWNSEIGLTASSYGDPQSNFYGYKSQGSLAAPYSGYEGVFASYSMGDFTGRISYIQPDQRLSTLPAGMDDELSVSVDYASGPFAVSAAVAQNAAGVKDADMWFLGAAYTINDAATIGLNYIDETGEKADATGDRTIVVYGSYAFGATTLAGYVANNDANANQTDTAYGIGASYDLGGATLTGAVHRSYSKTTYADLGVKFSF
ncbi:MAG: porin [Rhodobacteraceae bacterium]|jgi:outer membrane protein OmpU|nr:porin [Paracoccaceae bacterium]